MTKMYYPYSELKQDLKILIQKIDKPFDTIIPIARGGLSIAHLLGEYYGIRKVYAINTIGYNDTKKLDTIDVFNIPNLKDTQKALILDDIVDSGDTLEVVLEVLNKKYPNVTFYSASIFYKKSAKIAPTWYVKEAHNWIDFFWISDLI